MLKSLESENGQDEGDEKPGARVNGFGCVQHWDYDLPTGANEHLFIYRVFEFSYVTNASNYSFTNGSTKRPLQLIS